MLFPKTFPLLVTYYFDIQNKAYLTQVVIEWRNERIFHPILAAVALCVFKVSVISYVLYVYIVERLFIALNSGLLLKLDWLSHEE